MKKTRLADIPEGQMNDYWRNVLWHNPQQTAEEIRAALVHKDLNKADALFAELSAELNEVRSI